MGTTGAFGKAFRSFNRSLTAACPDVWHSEMGMPCRWSHSKNGSVLLPFK
jgi:hypothetical protein